MKNFQPTTLLSMAVATIAAGACVHRPSTTTATTGPTPASTSGEYTAGGEVTTTAANEGMWIDSTAGWWMDGNGSVRMGGRTGAMLGPQAADFAAMSDENIVAHLSAGDSLEVALSKLGVTRAQSSAVRDFAQRMVTEHSAHMQSARQFALQTNTTPIPAPNDTFDISMANRMMARLTSMPAGPEFDRRFMGAEVMFHRRMMHELQLMQAPANGAARQLVDRTIPVVQRHLTDAIMIWRQLGGGARTQ